LNTNSKFLRHAFEHTPNPRRTESRKGELARIDTLPKKAQKIWVAAYDKALEQHGIKGIAAAIAWATIKKQCFKDYDGMWKCPKIELQEEAKKLRKEVKKIRKQERSGKRYTPPEVSEEELLRRVRHLRR